ncbi:sugar-binding transcriptional regulator [Nakamurella leprariae]|uniref:Sugar-binding transcriptional regulator n=1 Tax=Nakamurella leprariae TaxID=2803911 RepID=A0A939BVS2_9ACTN|nr:sugar-binding domain-containing protein [Nakamurella leprariae]MBM9466808.1 hypothetical protein [Nakamurella leprariae]
MAALTPQRLAQAAFLYYVEDMGQAEVARLLGVSRSNVSRMLSAAREQKLVRFEIDYPTSRNHGLEAAVRAGYRDTRLKHVTVVDVEPDSTLEHGSPDGSPDGMTAEHRAAEVGALLAVCRGASEWLSGVLRNGQTIGLSWGRTIQTLVDSGHFDGRWDVDVVQLSGVASLDPARSGHDLVRDLAERIGGRYSYFHAPAVAPTREVARSLERSPLVASALRQARSVDVAVLGVGAFDQASSRTFLQEVAEATPAELAEAAAKGVVGQICGRFFDATGAQVDIALTERVLSIDLADIRALPTVAIVAAGPAKALAVSSALRGGLADIVVVDSALATALLDVA